MDRRGDGREQRKNYGGGGRVARGERCSWSGSRSRDAKHSNADTKAGGAEDKGRPRDARRGARARVRVNRKRDRRHATGDRAKAARVPQGGARQAERGEAAGGREPERRRGAQPKAIKGAEDGI